MIGDMGNRTEYYDRLTAIRESGDWEGWLKFFLTGVNATAEEATATSRAIVELREKHRALAQERGLGANGLRLLDLLFFQPIINVNLVAGKLEVTFATANNLIAPFQEIGLLEETTGGQRNRRFRYSEYLSLFPEDLLA